MLTRDERVTMLGYINSLKSIMGSSVDLNSNGTRGLLYSNLDGIAKLMEKDILSDYEESEENSEKEER